MLMANIIQDRQARKSAVTREPKKSSGLHTVSHRGRHRALDTLGMSSAIQHHADELCGKERGGEPGSRVKGRGPPGARRLQTTKVA